MNNETSSTAPETRNPQSAGEATGANNSSDFQDTAPQEILRQEQQQTLSVQDTGEPAPAGTSMVVDGGISMLWWAVLVIFAIAAGSFLAIKFLGDRDEAAEPILDGNPEPVVPEKTGSSASASAKPKKKSSKSKAGKPAKNKPRKKTAKKKKK